MKTNFALRDARYFAMRVVRRALFPGTIPARVARYIPGMGVSSGTTSATSVFRIYRAFLSRLDPQWLAGRSVLDLGCGETNSACYELAANGAASCHAVEPFIAMDEELDHRLLAQCAAAHAMDAVLLRAKVTRATDLRAIPSESIDLVVSNSVLEHVSDFEMLCPELRRVLRPGGRMLHAVDYRDHYFAFPYHHLLWSKRTWERFLNPGDLPRWRVGDHGRIFRRFGWEVTVLQPRVLREEFERVSARIHPEFRHYSAEDLQTAQAALLCTDA